MSSIKPLVLYGRGGINPAKVAIILHELDIQYTVKHVLLADIKKPEYVAVNPNGRLPALYDPNTDLTLFESGAIIEYLTERYDPENKISFAAGTNERERARAWNYFQASGQGPYFGQLSWFRLFAPSEDQMAIERYIGELKRVSGVLDAFLVKQQQETGSAEPYLVGNKLSYADLSFLTWYWITLSVTVKPGEFDIAEYPALNSWLERMQTRESAVYVKNNMYGKME